MPACSICGEEHRFLDPTFRRPDAYVQLDAGSHEHAKADDDLCCIALPNHSACYFVRVKAAALALGALVLAQMLARDGRR
jgi:hypothetical protein